MMNFEFRILNFEFFPNPPGDSPQGDRCGNFEIRNPKSEIARW
jgi:hypothetical protein